MHGVLLSYTRDRLKSPQTDKATRIQRLAHAGQGHYCRAGIRTGDFRMGARGLNRSATTAPTNKIMNQTN